MNTVKGEVFTPRAAAVTTELLTRGEPASGRRGVGKNHKEVTIRDKLDNVKTIALTITCITWICVCLPSWAYQFGFWWA